MGEGRAGWKRMLVICCDWRGNGENGKNGKSWKKREKVEKNEKSLKNNDDCAFNVQVQKKNWLDCF